MSTGTAFNPVGWFELYVADMPRARAFYEAVLQRTLTPLNNPLADAAELWAFPMTMGAMGASGALVKHPMKGPGDGGTLIYFSCQDCAVEAGRIAAAGGTVCQPKMAIGEYGHIVLAMDTEGNSFGLHSMV